VIRPARPGDSPADDDTDENHPAPISVSRTRTPADETLQDLLDRLKESADAAVPREFVLALERVRDTGAEDRLALERQLAEHVEAAAKRGAIDTRGRRIMRVVRGLSAGAVVSAFAVVARALIAHGDASAMARQQTFQVAEHGSALVVLRSQIESLRAQAAADHALISVFAARLSTAPTP
jgi:hypothetical protein